jgi:hypothetical protein
MTKSQRFFRYAWRVNAVLILVAAGTITLGAGAMLASEIGAKVVRSRAAKAGPVVTEDPSNTRLSLGHASVVPGTDVMRAELVVHTGGEGFSSGGYTEKRNILFIAPGEKAARWLLPDNDHVITDAEAIEEPQDTKKARAVATVVLVKPASGDPEVTKGELLLFDPAGKKIVRVANGVREMHIAALSGADLTIVYERDRRLVVASFDPGTLAKRVGQEIEIPPLK